MGRKERQGCGAETHGTQMQAEMPPLLGEQASAQSAIAPFGSFLTNNLVSLC